MTDGTAGVALELVHQEITREIIGAFFDVYNELGHGFAESVYQRALPIALSARGVRSEQEVRVAVWFRGATVGVYRADLIVEGKVIIESKVADRILPVHEMQLLNYLKATGITLGMVLNYGPQATFRRMLMTSPKAGSVVVRSGSA